MSNWNTLSRLSGPNATKDFLASMATAEKFLNPGKRKRTNPSAPPAEENPYRVKGSPPESFTPRPAPDLPPLREPEPAPRMDPDGADAAEVARLKRELADLADALVEGRDLRADETLAKHADWAEELQTRYAFTRENVTGILEQEIGQVFAAVLEHAGVYKCTQQGRDAFLRFIDSVG